LNDENVKKEPITPDMLQEKYKGQSSKMKSMKPYAQKKKSKTHSQRKGRKKSGPMTG